MRSRLKSVELIQKFETDLDNQTATITYVKSLDLESRLNELAEVNNKMADWSFIEKDD